MEEMIGYGGTGGGGTGGGGTSLSNTTDPAVQAELAAQQAAIKANLDRVKLIELSVGSLDVM